MLAITPAEKPYVCDHFDLLADRDDYLNLHLCEPTCDDPFGAGWNPLWMDYAAFNPFEALRRFGIDERMLQDAGVYICPYLRRHFHAVVPVMLYAKDPLTYDVIREKSLPDMFVDKGFQSSQYVSRKLPDRFAAALIGPGFTDGFRPSDGSSSLVQAEMGLSNGDRLSVAVWLWFNK